MRVSGSTFRRVSGVDHKLDIRAARAVTFDPSLIAGKSTKRAPFLAAVIEHRHAIAFLRLHAMPNPLMVAHDEIVRLGTPGGGAEDRGRNGAMFAVTANGNFGHV